MSVSILERLFEHNNWANLQILDACSSLNDAQLDAEPPETTYGSIRGTMIHLVSAQEYYRRLLTVPKDERERVVLDYGDLRASMTDSGAALLALAKDPSGFVQPSQLETGNGRLVDPWVLMLQAINHATEHREQIKAMLTAQGITPPSIDGWDYGLVVGALIDNSQ